MTDDAAASTGRRVAITTIAALLGGVLVALSMPPWGFWPLTFVGVALLEAAVRDEASRRRRAVFGLAFGTGWMYLALIWWWWLTPPGYLIGAALYAGLHATAAAWAPRGPWAVVARPAAHTLVESVRFSVPFGGVPLASLGIAQAGGPLLGVARVGGVILLTWIAFQVGALLPDAARLAVTAARSGDRRRPTPWVDRRPALGATAAMVLVVGVSAVAPAGRTLDVEPMTIRAVQGGGEQGTRALDVPSSIVTRRHVEATRTIEPSPELDLVVWPENGIDVDDEPFTESDEYALVAAEAARLGVPLSVGVTIDSEYSAQPVDGSFVNAQTVVLPDGSVGSWYEKVHIVPFGEYVPLRGVLEALGAPLEHVRSDATRGTGPAVLTIEHAGIEARLGVMISWEVFFGHRGRAADDGHILLNPTNGASYSLTVLQSQQVASSKLRATETGRWIVQVSPTGFSAFVSPNGDVLERTGVGEQAVIGADVPLRDGTTWYSALGDAPWWIGVLLVLALAWWAGRHERGRRTDSER